MFIKARRELQLISFEDVAVATGDVEEEQIRKLRDSMRELHQTQEVLIATQLEVKELRKRLGMADDAPV